MPYSCDALCVCVFHKSRYNKKLYKQTAGKVEKRSLKTTESSIISISFEGCANERTDKNKNKNSQHSINKNLQK